VAAADIDKRVESPKKSLRAPPPPPFQTPPLAPRCLPPTYRFNATMPLATASSTR